MKFIFNNISKFYGKYIVSFILGLVLTIIYLINNGFSYYINYVNGISIAGLVILFLSLLSLVTSFGAFDFFNYSFVKVFNRTKYKHMNDFLEDKRIYREKNKFGFVPYVIVGLLYIIVALIMMIYL